jgi:hypothetical protein
VSYECKWITLLIHHPSSAPSRPGTIWSPFFWPTRLESHIFCDRRGQNCLSSDEAGRLMFATDETEHYFKTSMWESTRRSWTYSLLETNKAPAFSFFINLCLCTFGDDHHYSDMTIMVRSLIGSFLNTRFIDVINRVSFSHKALRIDWTTYILEVRFLLKHRRRRQRKINP